MKSRVILGILVLALAMWSGCVRSPETQDLVSVPTAPSPSREDETAQRARVVDLYGDLPLLFVENRGQLDERVRFQARSPRATVFFTPTEVVFHFVETRRAEGDPPYTGGEGRADEEGPPRLRLAGPHGGLADDDPWLAEAEPHRALVLRVSFVGANPNPVVEGREELAGKVNIFKGNDPSKWLTAIPTYCEIVYRDLWPGIDLVYRGEEGCGLKYDLVVHPGADPEMIRFRYEGQESLSVNSGGELVVETPLGPITERAPYVYQEADVRHRVLGGTFRTVSADIVGYSVPAYDRSKPLVIDPGLVYSTFLGGTDIDVGWGIAVDASGCAYVTGYTLSSAFPTTPGAYDEDDNGDFDAFVAKINPAGNGLGDLVCSTFLGGGEADYGCGIAVDASGCAYIVGYTQSSDGFPTTAGAYDTDLSGGWDAFVAKINPAGNGLDDLVYSTLLGGGGNDYGKSIAVDASGCAYVTGFTNASFPTTPGAYDGEFNGGRDGFVAKINPAGNGLDDLVYSTLLGGSGDDDSVGISVDALGCAYVTGQTTSSDFPTPCGFDTTKEGIDAFVTKLNATGTGLVYSTFLGGSNTEDGRAIAVDTSGCAYVTGFTTSSEGFPRTPGAYDTSHNGGDDVFVSKLNASGSGLVYSTFLGGDSSDHGEAIAVDASGCAYVTGFTCSLSFPTTAGAHDRDLSGGLDAFVTKLTATGTGLVYSTLLGGSGSDLGYGIALDASGNSYVTGTTASSDFPPTPGAYGTSYSGNTDAFVTKIAFSASGYVNLAFLWDPVSQTLDLSAYAYDTAAGGVVTTGYGSYAIRADDGTCVASGSLSYNPSTQLWEANDIGFAHTGEFVAQVSVTGLTGSASFTTTQSLILIRGAVRDEAGEPVVGAAVELYDASGTTLLQAVSSTTSGYEFAPTPVGWYRIVTSKDGASAEVPAFRVSPLGPGVTQYVKDIVLHSEAVQEVLTYAAGLADKLEELMDRENDTLHGMSDSIDTDVSDYDLVDVAIRIFSIASGVYSVASWNPEADIEQLCRQTQVFTDKAAAVEVVISFYLALKIAEFHDLSTGMGDLAAYFLAPDDGGVEFGWTDGVPNHRIPTSDMKDTPLYQDSLAQLEALRQQLLAGGISPHPDFSPDRAIDYIQAKYDDLETNLQLETYDNQCIVFLPETDCSFPLALRPLAVRFVKDEVQLYSLKLADVVNTGVKIAGTASSITGVGAVVLAVSTTVGDFAISQMETNVKTDICQTWELAGCAWAKDIHDMPAIFESIADFLLSEIETPYYLSSGRSFECDIGEVQRGFPPISLLGYTVPLPETSVVTLDFPLTNTGETARISATASNYASDILTMGGTAAIPPMWLANVCFRFFSGQELVKFQQLTDIGRQSENGVGTSESIQCHFELLTGVGLLEMALDQQLIKIQAYAGPWLRDEKIVLYNLLLVGQEQATAQGIDPIVAGIRTQGDVCRLSDLADMVTRIREQIEIQLDSSTTEFTQEVVVPGDVHRLIIRLHQVSDDVDLHAYKGDLHVGLDPDAGRCEAEFPATYSGAAGNPEEIAIPSAAGNTYLVKATLARPRAEGSTRATIVIMEEPQRPATMAVTPAEIEAMAFPGQQDLSIEIRIAEVSQQHPLTSVSVAISEMTNAHAQSLVLTSEPSYERDVLPAGSGDNWAFAFSVPQDATGVYTGTVSIESDQAGAAVLNVTVIVDEDEDGLPDFWELQHFESLGQDPSGDPDSDTLTNLAEYEHNVDPMDPDTDDDGVRDGVEVTYGLDPLDANDCVLLPSIGRSTASPGWVSLMWVSSSSFTVYWSDDLESWDAVDGPALTDIVDNGDGTWTWTDKGTDPDMMGQAPGDVEKRFYRVGVENAPPSPGGSSASTSGSIASSTVSSTAPLTRQDASGHAAGTRRGNVRKGEGNVRPR